ncbi:hypothetical protein [Burkholderia cenocepacia]|uniref:hypothetical protein n=1 Tax=Burkholderia cenocepacia TaxID=95486 RepID=UPI00076193C6|nr:hypothetical protein [Burkholderia cenocepacia]KWU26299.1 hypothetical protein AS149_25240 [Burkholderia cenocepacia]
MKREQVKVVVQNIPATSGEVNGTRRIGIVVNDELMGEFVVAKGEALVPQALILVGFATVDVFGVGLKQKVTELWHVRKTAFQHGWPLSAKVDGRRGQVALKQFHVVGMDKVMFDVFFNGQGTWKWAEPYLDDIGSLVTMLDEYPFDVSVEHVAVEQVDAAAELAEPVVPMKAA